jgi:hypothetical protein
MSIPPPVYDFSEQLVRFFGNSFKAFSPWQTISLKNPLQGVPKTMKHVRQQAPPSMLKIGEIDLVTQQH